MNNIIKDTCSRTTVVIDFENQCCRITSKKEQSLLLPEFKEAQNTKMIKNIPQEKVYSEKLFATLKLIISFISKKNVTIDNIANDGYAARTKTLFKIARLIKLKSQLKKKGKINSLNNAKSYKKVLIKFFYFFKIRFLICSNKVGQVKI
uniref:Transposase n=1 Tax=Strongyloides venezuelensis TaxID=75913 RepID=A0A0K0G6A0_STRVS